MKSRIVEALDSGHRASSMLNYLIEEVAKLNCPKAYGFEGAETYFDCGECVVCFCKEIMKNKKQTIGLLKFINGSFQSVKIKSHESETITHNWNPWKADKDQEYWVEIISADLVTDIREDGPYLKGVLK